ncbi:Uncharacterised protein [Neisseria canis]|uniref:Uncharacterized protein n=1 Tax=Neisseria canis TaxID=493 RepID=A0A3S4NWH0_9NEIS|nr:Uncharacterised protein [Neisseria canis]
MQHRRRQIIFQAAKRAFLAKQSAIRQHTARSRKSTKHC